MTSKLDELDRLASLRDRGVLSESEFAQAKAEVLGGVSGSGTYASSAARDHVYAQTIEDAGANPDFPLWAILRPIQTAEQASSLLYAGYYAATAICAQGAIFLSRQPVVSATDNVILVVVLAILAAVSFLAARSVAKKASVGAAWTLLIFAGCQAFGTATGGRWDWGMIALGTAGLLISIQAVRATSTIRRLSSTAAPTERQRHSPEA